MPISGNVLLDTSVIIPYLKGDVSIRTQSRNYLFLYLPQTALGELYCGAYLSNRPNENLGAIQTFLAAVILLLPTAATSEHYGRIRAKLAKAGTPIPENYIWIAAIAVEHNLPLAARDAHFDRVPGLSSLKW